MGEAVEITVEIRNEGIIPVTVPVTLHFPSASKQPETRRPRADPGETVVTTFTWRTSNYEPGIHEFRVEAPGTSRAFTAILSAPMSDFSVVEAFLPNLDVPIIQGDRVEVSALVRNAGPQAGRTSVALMDASRGLVLYEDNVSLEAHESRWLELAWKTARYDVGAYHLMVGTDAPNDTNPGNDVADVGVANIVDDGDITVGYGGSDFASQYRDQLAKPDIGALPKFSFGEIQWTPQEPVVGEAVEITVEIRNEGTRVGNTPVTLHFPSSDKQPETRRPRIEAGSIAEASFTWRTSRYAPGIHAFRVETDFGNQTFFVELLPPTVDFEVVDIYPPNSAYPIVKGDWVEVEAFVRNIGKYAGKGKITLWNLTHERPMYEKSITLEPEESSVVVFTWKTLRYEIGEHLLRVESEAERDTDPFNDYSDTASVNVITSRDITIGFPKKFAGPFSARRNHPPTVATDSEVSAEISVVSAHPTFAMRQQYSPSWLESGSNELAGTRPQASGPAYTRGSDRAPSPLICAQQRRLTHRVAIQWVILPRSMGVGALIVRGNYRIAQYLDQVVGPTSCSMFDLLAAGDAHDGHLPIGFGFDGGEQGQAADLHGDIVVLLLEPEGAGHAAAACVDQFDLVTGRQVEHEHGVAGPGDGLLVAVAVEHHLLVQSRELQVEFVGGVGLGQELVDEE